MTHSHGTALLAAAALLLPCAGCSSDDQPAGGPAAVTVTIRSTGVDPANVSVAASGKVTFVNEDSIVHTISSNPHPTHTDCPELDSPELPTGASFVATMGASAKTCGYHDHLNPTETAFQGTVTTTTASGSGGGNSGGGY